MEDIAGNEVPEKFEDHGKTHMWVWVHEEAENDAFTRIIYEDVIQDADIVCAVPGCGLTMPGSAYIGVVEKMRQFLHLGEDEHITRLQDMLEIMALKYEHKVRTDLSKKDVVIGAELGDKK